MTILEKLKYLHILYNLCNNGTADNPDGYEDFEPLTISDLKSVGKDALFEYLEFGNWNDHLILLPLWIVPFMEPTSIVKSINGQLKILKDCDLDGRFGCIAYGFIM